MTKILAPLSSQIVAHDEKRVLVGSAREDFFVEAGGEKKILLEYGVQGEVTHEVFIEVGEGALCEVSFVYRAHEKGTKIRARVCVLLGKNAAISCDIASMCDAMEAASDVRVFVVFSDGARAVARAFTCASAPRGVVHEEIRGLMVGDIALATFIPELSLLHDDIVATHATSLEKINEKRLSYFLSRGVSRDHAMKCLVDAFLAR